MKAKAEFLRHVGTRPVLCADIFTEPYGPLAKECRLCLGYSEEDFAYFLNALSFEYDNDYGFQELYGTIWYRDGSWSERGEYDGAEWWEHKQLPEIPDTLKPKS